MIHLLKSAATVIGRILCDAPALESRAYGDGFEYGQQVAYDRMALYFHDNPEETR